MKKTPRSTARELALLALSQLPKKSGSLEKKQLQEVVLAAVRTLRIEAQDILETAAAELQRGSDRLLNSQIDTTDIESARVMLYEAIELGQTAINRIGTAVELPEMLQLTNQLEVRSYAMEVLTKVNGNRKEVDKLLQESIVDWQIERLPRIDLDILRIAVAEMMFIGIQKQVAISEAVELAKRYSGEDGYKFINGVLRRVFDKINVI
ncbi:NusB antitermination factor [Trichodesmium erythraeum IMS101]|uniref:Transcription antitermination protein NusB n=1 Tax=Trichodesmium erythraeum (strain IMS101) TaxID=203124 RepID=NUSB_TRIEI|nr:RecName: Full=Transcription antitermination protein NusB; AltName: Full=Antitermination factor NusB [Trichodesmium erythraeum IMS101]MBS9772482.1 transcription antitermination protein NusB [Trichodesmium erythraeum GBRTRLIN201]MCH2048512.1 transcription antitermination factor NusB [Trichodesmium sp. ALOHA_ZT_67]MDE5096320.1 transcription antitermination factor NusB [Trichodesmium sp. St11_bin5]MDT9338479.1 transcription antitermination factor NusB [Trichodesmium erythraeum 21-75]